MRASLVLLVAVACGGKAAAPPPPAVDAGVAVPRDAGIDVADGAPEPVDEGTDAAIDLTTPDPGPIPVVSTCGAPVAGGKPIGAPCTDSSECATGYCYDEALWNEVGPPVNRFCTVACKECPGATDCAAWPTATGAGLTRCVGFPGYYVAHFGLAFKSVCLASCDSDAQCTALDPFSVCAGLSFGKEASFGVFKFCQPASFPVLPPETFN